ncbi:uncharacterized protein LOC100937994 [Pongo abelii]|uniref:uncharacterized protein LOC100937994 n=1 Tax=Pongo abelii TaxID=9601 RepID=UPI000CEFA789|nr:uncharacterized protein LOC100937994 [Pongo abelii]
MLQASVPLPTRRVVPEAGLEPQASRDSCGRCWGLSGGGPQPLPEPRARCKWFFSVFFLASKILQKRRFMAASLPVVSAFREIRNGFSSVSLTRTGDRNTE